MPTKPETTIEVYEILEGSDMPNPDADFFIDTPPFGPPAVGDRIQVLAAAVRPGDNPYVVDAYFEVVARSLSYSPVFDGDKLSKSHVPRNADNSAALEDVRHQVREDFDLSRRRPD